MRRPSSSRRPRLLRSHQIDRAVVTADLAAGGSVGPMPGIAARGPCTSATLVPCLCGARRPKDVPRTHQPAANRLGAVVDGPHGAGMLRDTAEPEPADARRNDRAAG